MTEQRNIIAEVITEMSVMGHPDVNEIFLKQMRWIKISVLQQL